MRQEFSAVPFLDGQHAKGHLTRLEQCLAPVLFVPLASLLAQSPDPDGALGMLQRYAEAAPPEVLEELALHPSTLTYLVAIFSYSETLGETFLSDPSLVLQFVHDRHFTRLKSVEDLMQDYARYSVTHPDLWLASQLARFKRRNLLRIALKDVLGLSTLGETTLELSTLADVILKNALTYCDQELEKRYGWPQFRDAEGRIARSGFSIVSLGKLGGNELNYSSDIDLLFLYAGDGQTAGGSESSSTIPNKEYFVRLAEAINRTITQTTPHGEVYHIDLRERPEGEKGDLAISVKSALEYYDHRARDWELQMLIKARHSAGDLWVTREFLHGVEPYVYRSAGNVDAIESVMDKRERTSTQRRDSPAGPLDVKFHPGGIRDIEFLIQCLQRVHGRSDSWVRSGGTLLALRKLNDKGLLSDVDFARLTSSYEFFRKVEHRIQLKAEQHAHRLPLGHAALNRLARRLGMEGGTPAEAGVALVAQLKQAFALVEEICKRLVHGQPTSTSSADFQLSAEVAWSPDPELDHLDGILRLLEARSPVLARIVREAPLRDRASKDAARLLTALLRSSEYFRTTRENPERLRRALQITAASPHLAQVMIQHPEDLATLDLLASEGVGQSPNQMEIGLIGAISEGAASAPGANSIVSASPCERSVFPWAADEGLSFSQKMALLRTEYRIHALRLGARDCTVLSPIFTCLNRWTSLAVRCLASALTMAVGPQAQSGSMPIAVLGLGRLGMNEFDLASSAELAFVVAAGNDGEGLTFARRLADRIAEALCSYTHDGSVFAVDAFPLPQGDKDVTVVSEDVLTEHLSEGPLDQLLGFANARPVAGDLELGRHVVARLTEALFERFEPGGKSDDGLHDLFKRMAGETPVLHSGAHGAFGEVELTLSILRLRQCVKLPAETNVPNQVAALCSTGHISARDAGGLTQGVSFLRSVDHAVRLVTGLKPGSMPENYSRSEEVEALTRHWGLIGKNDSLPRITAVTHAQVQSLCHRLLDFG
jgi:glutamate-ammonia-ligase adenylyltransferase